MKDPESTFQRLVPDAIPYHFSTGVLVHQMHQAVKLKRRKTFARLLVAVKQAITGKLDALEKAQVHLECARAAFQLGGLDVAREELDSALHILTPLAGRSNEHRHFHGVALWMMGSLVQLQQGNTQMALNYFKECLANFEILALPFQTVWPTTEWYRECCAEMRQYLNNFWELSPQPLPAPRPVQPAAPLQPPKPPGGPAMPSGEQIQQLPVAVMSTAGAPSGGAGAKGAAPAGAPPKPPSGSAGTPTPRSTGSRPEWVRAVLHSSRPRLLEIIGQIPAGGFGPDGLLPYALDRLRVEGAMKEFFLQGVRCHLYSLRGQLGQIGLSRSRNYFILKVTGDSMDRAGIGPGNFVLVVQQDTADENDIVAAEVIGTDSQATLKAFSKRGKRAALLPRSRNQKHQEQFFDLDGNGFAIRGVVIGVFKPKRRRE